MSPVRPFISWKPKNPQKTRDELTVAHGSAVHLPSGDFRELREGRNRVWYRPEAEGWVRDALGAGLTLHEWSARSPWRGKEEPGTLQGRAPLYLTAGEADEIWAVRHFVRGGWVEPVLGDRFLRSLREPEGLRPFHEARASERLRRRGVPTPEVVAAAVYLAGPVYRGDLVTRYLDGFIDLAEVLFAPEGASEAPSPPEALLRAGSLVRWIAAAGAYHRDLNAKNIVLPADGKGLLPRVLDLDRCRVSFHSRFDPRAGDRMLRRLARSLRKWERRTGKPLPSEAWEALRNGYREGAFSDGAGDPPRSS